MSAYPHVRPLKTSKATFKSWLCILGMKTLKAHSYKQREVFHAPFFTTRFCTAWTGLFCPLCLTCLFCFRRDKDSLKVSLKTIAQNFRDRGITFSKFMTRCCLFCMLWLVTDYMHVYSLRILDCTDVMALYSAHVSFVFLLSWMILHDQFVGVRTSSRRHTPGRLQDPSDTQR
ncbi:solute carrier family 35 member F3-like isoform X2 [Scylla paramamosain]|uniref:solute carrier family 35 member F3-like isoform X2 n=1 Tax=Scylla paramamosain TaxID=85552 RepID=UPI003083A1C7